MTRGYPEHRRFGPTYLPAVTISGDGDAIAILSCRQLATVAAPALTAIEHNRSHRYFEELPKGPDLDGSVAGLERMTAPVDSDRKFAWSRLARHANWWEPGALKPGDAATVSGSHLFYQIRIETISARQALW